MQKNYAHFYLNLYNLSGAPAILAGVFLQFKFRIFNLICYTYEQIYLDRKDVIYVCQQLLFETPMTKISSPNPYGVTGGILE